MWVVTCGTMRLTRCLPSAHLPKKRKPSGPTWAPSRQSKLRFYPHDPCPSHQTLNITALTLSLCQSQRLVQRRDNKTITFSLLTFHTYTYGELPVLPRKFELRTQIEEEEEMKTLISLWIGGALSLPLHDQLLSSNSEQCQSRSSKSATWRRARPSTRSGSAWSRSEPRCSTQMVWCVGLWFPKLSMDIIIILVFLGFEI